MALQTYPAAKSTGRCAATGAAFAPGQVHVATLVERPGEATLDRLDFSVEAWAAGARPQPPLKLFGFWKAHFSSDAPKGPALLSDPELLELFEELADTTEPKRQAFRYLLALLLVRRRVLRLLSTRGREIHVLPKGADLATTPPIVVAEPNLDETLLSEAVEQLNQIVPGEQVRA